MNKITYAGMSDADGEIVNKNFEVFLPDGAGKILWKNGEAEFFENCAIVVPPLIKCKISRRAHRIILDKAILPFKDVTIVPDDENGGIKHAVAQIIKYSDGALKKSNLILCELGALLAAYVTAFADKKSFSPAVEIIRSEIEKGISDCTFSLEDCLNKLPLNYDYVRKLFKKEVGATPHEYLMRGRMELARQLILSEVANRYSAYTVSQVAESCGFSDPLYFSRVFKKYFGVSPSEYN